MSKERPKLAYLGCGTYADYDGQQLWLGTRNVPHLLALEPFAISNLIDYWQRVADALDTTDSLEGEQS